jgi:NAD(P)-dependent dehydrogenase (short-subunit alcohol dehydrogenase family)
MPVDPRTALPDMSGRTVAVTGGASGIGRATAVMVAEAGARVVAGDIKQDSLSELAKFAAATGLGITCTHLDVADPASIDEFITSAAGAESPLTGLVCSAGISPDVALSDMTLDQWNLVLTVNLTANFLAVQRAAAAMMEHGEGGSIVTVGSAVGTSGRPNLAHYAASKGGLVAFTKSAAQELGPQRIRVNCVSPGGGVNTPLMWGRITQARVDDLVAKSPMRRIGEPEDVARCIGFLLCDLSTWMTGQNLHVNGGSLMW